MNDPFLKVPRILWLALLGSQALYVYLLTFGDVVPPVDEPPPPAMAMTMAGVAVGIAVVSFVLPALLRRSAAGRVHPGDRRAAYAAAFAPFILSLALSEAVSILGLVLGFTGHSIATWAPFIACGMLLTAWRFPTESRMIGPVQRADGVIVG